MNEFYRNLWKDQSKLQVKHKFKEQFVIRHTYKQSNFNYNVDSTWDTELKYCSYVPFIEI